MRRTALWLGAGLALGAAAACGGGSDGGGDGTFLADAGSDARATTSSSSSGALGADGGSSGLSSSGTTDDGGTEPDGGGSSSSSSSSSGGSSGLPPQCGGNAVPGTDLGVVLDFGATAPAYVTVSEDGLSAAWVTGVDGDVDVSYADRDDLEGTFGSAQVLAHQPWALDRVALGFTGLAIAGVHADRYGFDSFARATRGDAFATAAQDPFGNVNEQGADAQAAGQRFGDPVLARSDSYFVYSRYGTGATQTLLLGTRILLLDTVYSGGTAFTDATFLAQSGTNRRRPVALTSDQRTLFYFDEVDSTAYATTRDDAGGEFGAPTSLGARLDARPINGCGTLVFRDPLAPTELRAISYQ